MQRLLARADAVMHNMRGDAAARLGIDYASAKALNPDIVYLYAGSYGSTGPGAGRAAFHPMMGALSGGALRQLGRGNEPPAADVPLTEQARYEYSLADPARQRGLAGHHRRARRGTALSAGLLHRQLHRPRPVRRDHDAGQQPAALLGGRHPLRGPARTAPGRFRAAGYGALNRLYRTASGWLFLCSPTDPEWRRCA